MSNNKKPLFVPVLKELGLKDGEIKALAVNGTVRTSCVYKTDMHTDNNASASFTINDDGTLMYHCLSCGAKGGILKLMYDAIFNDNVEAEIDKNTEVVIGSFLNEVVNISRLTLMKSINGEISDDNELINLLSRLFKVGKEPFKAYFTRNGYDITNVLKQLKQDNVLRVWKENTMWGNQSKLLFPIGFQKTIYSLDNVPYGIIRPLNDDGTEPSIKTLMPKQINHVKSNNLFLPSNLFIKQEDYNSIEDVVVFVEGEKDMLLLRMLGVNAFSFLSGAKSFNKDSKGFKYIIKTLQNKQVVIMSDNDAAGKDFASDIVRAIVSIDENIVVKDISKTMFTTFRSIVKDDISDIFKKNIDSDEFNIIDSMIEAINITKEIDKNEYKQQNSDKLIKFYEEKWPSKIKNVDFSEIMKTSMDNINTTFAVVDSILDTEKNTYDFNSEIKWKLSLDNLTPYVKPSASVVFQPNFWSPIEIRYKLADINNSNRESLIEKLSSYGVVESWKTPDGIELLAYQSDGMSISNWKRYIPKKDVIDILCSKISNDSGACSGPLFIYLYHQDTGYQMILLTGEMNSGMSDIQYLKSIFRYLNKEGYEIITTYEGGSHKAINESKVFKDLLVTTANDIKGFILEPIFKGLLLGDIMNDVKMYNGDIMFGVPMIWTPRVINIFNEKKISNKSDELTQAKMWKEWVTPITTQIINSAITDKVNESFERMSLILNFLYGKDTLGELSLGGDIITNNFFINEVTNKWKGLTKNNKLGWLTSMISYEPLHSMNEKMPRWSVIKLNKPESSPFFTLLTINEQKTLDKLNSLDQTTDVGVDTNKMKFIIENSKLGNIKPNDLIKITYIPVPENKKAKKLGMIIKTELMDVETQDPTEMNKSIEKFRSKTPKDFKEFLTHLKRLYLTAYRIEPKFPFDTWLPLELLYNSVSRYTEEMSSYTKVIKGALDVLLIGDSQSGKSSVSDTYISWYNSGSKTQLTDTTINAIIGGTEKAGNETMIGAFAQHSDSVYIIEELSGASNEKRMEFFRASKDARKTGKHSVIRVAGASKVNIDAYTRFLAISNPVSEGGSEVFATINEFRSKYPNKNIFSLVGTLIPDGAAINRFNWISFVEKQDRSKPIVDEEGNTLTGYDDIELKDFRLKNIRLWSLKPENVVLSYEVKKYLEKEAMEKLIKPLDKQYVKNVPELASLVTEDVVYDNLTRLSFSVAGIMGAFDTNSGDNDSYKKLTMTKNIIDITIGLTLWNRATYGLDDIINTLTAANEIKKDDLQELLFSHVQFNNNIIDKKIPLALNEEKSDMEKEEINTLSTIMSLWSDKEFDYLANNIRTEDELTSDTLQFNKPLFDLYRTLSKYSKDNSIKSIKINLLNEAIKTFYAQYFTKENALGSKQINTFFKAIGLDHDKRQQTFSGTLPKAATKNNQSEIINSIRGVFFELWDKSGIVSLEAQQASSFLLNGAKISHLLKEVQQKFDKYYPTPNN